MIQWASLGLPVEEEKITDRLININGPKLIVFFFLKLFVESINLCSKSLWDLSNIALDKS